LQQWKKDYSISLNPIKALLETLSTVVVLLSILIGRSLHSLLFSDFSVSFREEGFGNRRHFYWVGLHMGLSEENFFAIF
jgi:hypothetical protein